ncbi:AAA domain-containing protein [Sphingomonas sp. CL5.1]|uniref:AAA family ATPase n=1 Tax=Sphingomonas sp. CL5.1 TaxID=2653203 RepID=UPI001581BE44|nr:AAA family ATPase [Sphingomonas sp. CL5.1]QKR98571.1 AAA domain-containing protein [Sphingomonas sp. CL5.1]
MAKGQENRQKVFSWFSTFLRDQNLLFQRPGSKGGSNLGNHTIDAQTGNWGNLGYSKGKPPRWLFQVDLNSVPVVARLPEGAEEASIGGVNTAQGQSAAVTVRILPLLQTGPDAFERADEFEVAGLFVFHGPLQPAGSSSDPVNFNVANGSLFRVFKEEDPETGETKRVRVDSPYIFAALIGLLPRNEAKQVEIGGAPVAITYGEVVDALQAAITAHPQGGAAGPIAVYDLSDDNEAARLRAELTAAWDGAGPPPQVARVAQQDSAEEEDEGILEIDPATLNIPENTDLLGVDPSVYRQINALLRSGKQHIMLYGPPGTGKTTLARWIADNLPGGEWTLVTGSSDWSSQDIIGGYQPVGDGDVDFVPGILLRDFDRPFIIDELNRCDIDKVIGPLFTVLSGQQTTLPYRTDITDKNSQPYVILPKAKPGGAGDHEFSPGAAWRLIATINSIDKASLYQMSYALSRRFGWVYVDAPGDLRGFIAAFIAKTDPAAPVPAAGDSCPLADVWTAINSARVIGSAPIIDAIAAIRQLVPDEAFFGPASDAMRSAALDALDMVLLPMLDGIVLQDAHNIADATATAFALSADQAARVKSRLEAVAI